MGSSAYFLCTFFALLCVLTTHSAHAEVCGGLDCGPDACCSISPTSAACYQSSRYACLASSTGNILCSQGDAACSGPGVSTFCYNPSLYTCQSGLLQQKPAGESTSQPTNPPTTSAPTTSAPTNPPTTTPTTAAPTVSNSGSCGSNQLNCGQQSCCLSNSGEGRCFSGSDYVCSNGILCPLGTQGCGNNICYSPSQYTCVNGQLQQGGSTPSTATPTTTTTSPVTTTPTTTSSPVTATPTTTSSPVTPTPTTTGAPGTKVPVKLWGINYRSTRPSGWCGTLADVEADLRILATLTTRIRIYSLVDCNQGELILQAIQNTGVNLTVTFGLWLDGLYHTAEFPNEYNALLAILNSGARLDKVDDFIVGSETQYRGDFSWEVLRGYMQNISATLATYGYSNIDVVTSDVVYNLIGSPIVDFENVVYVNQFPYWEGSAVEQGQPLLANTINTLRGRIGNKPFIIGETGWPTGGNSIGASVPSVANLNAYLEAVVCFLNRENIGYFWFSAFDEPFRAEENGNTVERFFGLYTGDRTPKAGLNLPVMCPA